MSNPLRPIVTTTTTSRDYLDGNTPETQTVTETNYRMESADTVWLSLGGLTVSRGDRYQGKEEILKVENYSADLFRSAVLGLVSDQLRNSRTETGHLKDRADSFLGALRDLLN